jgi:hypothetical protein
MLTVEVKLRISSIAVIENSTLALVAAEAACFLTKQLFLFVKIHRCLIR